MSKQTGTGLARASSRIQETLDNLAKNPARIQARLGHEMQHMMGILPQDLAGYLKADYEKLISSISTADVETGKIPATCSAMTDDQASAVVEALINLRENVDEELRALDAED